MNRNYEFAHQSRKQKAILIGTKVIVLLMFSHSLYVVGWVEQSNIEKMNSVAGVFTFVWIYITLLNVKYEIKELFVPPFNIFNGIEFMLVGACLGLYWIFRIIENIVRIHLGF